VHTTLKIKDLSVEYHTFDGIVKAVNNLNLEVKKGESIGLVGETGAGKTTTALSILKLLPYAGHVVNGEIEFNGKSLLKASEQEMYRIRGNKISMVFQDPLTSLNPVYNIGTQIRDVLTHHQSLNKEEAIEKAKEMIELVGIPSNRLNEYPHQFSGGMRQRVGIALALACNPELLIADEPTTALDVTIQAQILALMTELKQKFQMSLIMITHNLGIVAEVCDSVAVMYSGEIIEIGSVKKVFNNPMHYYTKGLFGSVPSPDVKISRLNPIKGRMPDPKNLPKGCKFYPRCNAARPECLKMPELIKVEEDHFVACVAGKEGV